MLPTDVFKRHVLQSIVLPLFLLAFLAASTMTRASEFDTSKANRPSVLLIMTDDQGWGDITSHGNPSLSTPHLDGLADSGARLDRFYVSPVCAPTRAGLLTGRYHLRTGTHGVTRGQENMRGDETTLAELLRDAGYRTGCFGKWHNGASWPYNPNGQGFDEFLGFCSGHWNNYFSTELEHNGRTVQPQGFIADVLTDAAINFIEAESDQPFFCYVPLNTPHSPWQVPDKYWDRHADKGLDDKARCAFAMVENIDDNVGRLLTALETNGRDKNTIVVFLTDNGPNSNRFNGDMRGRKGSVHEGGSRVPCFIRYPDHIAAGTVVPQITANIDLLPTLCEFCSIELPGSLELDGASLTPLLARDASSTWPDRHLCVFRGKGERGAVRSNKWRGVMNRPGKWMLFDMEVDPQESNDLAKKHPEIVAELRSTYEKVLADSRASELEPLPISIGHDEWPRVKLPGHEAHLERAGQTGISYVGANGWANDWITNWMDPAAFAWWPVDVHQAGRYNVTVEYGMSQASPASEVVLIAGKQTLAGKITETHELATIPSPDRIERGEVYEKVWKTVDLGIIELEKGVARLELRHPNADRNPTLQVKSIRLQIVK